MWGVSFYLVRSGIGCIFRWNEFKVSSQILAMIPYVITLITLIIFVGEASGPAANGLPYEKNQD